MAVSERFPVTDESFPKLVPPMKDLVVKLKECVESGASLQGCFDELRNADIVLAAFCECFRHTMFGTDYDEEEGAIVGKILGAFEGFGGLMSSLFCDVANEEVEDAVRDINVVVEQIKLVEDCLSELKEREKHHAVLSELPVINALLRAGNAVLEGRRGWKILATKLEDMRPMAESMTEHGEMPPVVAAHFEALSELYRVCDEEDIDALEAALAAVKETGEFLVKTSRIEKGEIEEESSLLCPRCGSSIRVSDRICPSCNARLPERLDLSNDTPLNANINLPEYVQRIFNAADRLHAGDGSAWSEFSSAVAEMKRRVNHTHANFTRLPEKPANAPADEEEAFAVSKEAMENGLAKFFQAISIFDSLNPHNLDVGMMDCGLEALIAGVEETRQVGAAIQRLMSSRM